MAVITNPWPNPMIVELIYLLASHLEINTMQIWYHNKAIYIATDTDAKRIPIQTICDNDLYGLI